MPRLPINYANTQIYRFVCNDVNIVNTYVGSTTNWTKRKASHKCCCNNPNHNFYHYNVYQVIRANGGWDNWNMVLVENYPCNGRREVEQREQFWKEYYNDDMGLYKAFTTKEQKIEQHIEYRNVHKVQIAKQRAEHYQTNKNQILKQRAEYRATHQEQIKKCRAEYQEQYNAKEEKSVL